MEDSKVCIGCGETKILTEFYRNHLGYYQSRCKPCSKSQVRQYWKDNPEKRRAQVISYRERNRNTPRLKARQIKEGMFRRSRKKGLPEPEWTLNEIEEAIQGRCAKTGIRFEFDQSKFSKSPWTPVPDRIDSSQGYTHENVQWVCHMFNSMKQEYTEVEVERFTQALRAPGDF